MTITNMSNPETPSNMKAKLNPAVAAFTPAYSNGKESAKSGSVQTSSPTKDEPKSLVVATDSKEEGFIPPHLRRVHNMSTNEEPVTASKGLAINDKIKSQDPVATSVQNGSSKETEAHKSPSMSPAVLPHLRRPKKATETEKVQPHNLMLQPHNLMPAGMKDKVQISTTPATFVKHDPGLQAWLDTQETIQPNNASNQELITTINDTLIDIVPDSPEKGTKKAAILPPGFIPFSANDGAPAKTQTAAPIKTDTATSPATVFDNVITSNSTAQDAYASTKPKASTKFVTEKERNAAFLAQYTNTVDSVYAKYSRDSSHNSSSEDKAYETDPFQTKSV